VTAAVSALIVRVSEAEACVGALRARFDPSARLGVPAHVTLLHPFIAPGAIDAAVLAQIGAIAAATEAFAFRLAEIRRFPGTLYLAPEPAEPFIELTRRLAARFPGYPPYGGRHPSIVPHLTVAQTEPAPSPRLEEELRAALDRLGPIGACCRAFELIENASGRWQPMHRFELGSAPHEIGTR